MLQIDLLKQVITKTNIVSQKELDTFATQAGERNISLEEFLIKEKIVTEQQLYKTTAEYLGIPFIDLKTVTIRKDILFLVPEPIASTHRLIAFNQDNQFLYIATSNPENLEIFEFLRKKTNLEIKIHVAEPNGINEALKMYHKGLKAEFKELTQQEEKQKEEEGGTKLSQLARDLPVIRVVDTLLEYAILENASDIHIEPLEENVNVRYRIDGVLKNVMTLPKSIHAGLVARIKILSNLKLDEHRLPQDSRFTIETKEYKVSFRVSIIPTYDGEKVVMRALNEQTGIIDLDKLGFQKDALDTVKRNIEKPNGLILVTGPTGSGKTTTLYSILHIINKPEVNITTIEDPIEYHLPGLNQSQINPKIGYTFATGLRAFLRQDPDIIMVGEIRDEETAEIAIHAALTGHLVLSTLHTNDAPTTLPRLSEMGVPAFLVASTANVIIAQRLVRKICPDCKTSYQLDAKTVTKLEKQINLQTILQTLTTRGVIQQQDSSKTINFYRGTGCATCGQTGYKGRMGIYEVLEVTSKISELIIKGAGAEELSKTAKDSGMLTMMEDGFIKAVSGITTIEEILRVSND